MAWNPYQLLDRPIVYNTVQFICALPGVKRIEAKINAKLFADSQGLILDVGCGPKRRSPLPTAGKMVGIDLNPEYVRSYTGGFVDTDTDVIHSSAGDRSVLGYACSAAQLPFADGLFDEARSRAVFHHFSPDLAVDALREMVRCVKPGGRVVLMDCVWPRRPWLRPVGWLIYRLDRGEWMRTEEQLVAIAHATQPTGWSWFRYTVAYTGQEAIVLTYQKPLAARAPLPLSA
jgi:SAM-dependent methyltransferase